MTGLEKIIDRIGSDADTSSDKIIAAANAQAKRMTDEAAQQVRKEAVEIAARSAREAKNTINMAKSTAKYNEKQIILAAKVTAVRDVIKAAKKSVDDLPDNIYFAYIARLFDHYARNEEGIMHFNAADLARLPNDFDKILASKSQGKPVKISMKPIDIPNGFILSYGEVDENCTFDALIDDNLDEIKEKIAEIIF